MFDISKKTFLYMSIGLVMGIVSSAILHLDIKGYLILISFFLLLSVIDYVWLKNLSDKPKEIVTDNVSDVNEEQLLRSKLEQMTKRAKKFENDIKTTELFLASMSHELRTPLNGIIGITEVLDDTKLDSEQKEFVSMIRESSNNLRVIVNDILDVSKINAGKMELESIEFDLFSKIEASVGVFITKMEEKDIVLNLYTDPKIPQFVIGDPTRLSQVIINLVSNAIKFTKRGGCIGVYAKYIRQSDDSVTFKISVKDSGVGLTPEQQRRIFEAYTQADASTTRKAGGTGLGLTISGKIVEIMGSKLRVFSKEGEGATFYFTITLPISKEHKADLETFEGLKVGAYLSDTNPNSKWYEILEDYLGYFKANFIKYDTNDISNAQDILIVDYENIKDDTSLLKGIESKKVVLVSSNASLDVSSDGLILDKVLHRPLSLEKLINILKLVKPSLSEDVVEKRETKEKQIRFDDIKVLVAEDNVINQKLIIAVLNNFGLNVTIANNGEEAIKLRKENEYDIIFMDIQMPVMGGEEATAKILEYEKENNLKHIPIIALTANALKGDKEKYMAKGMDGYTTKPLDIKAIEELIVKFCNIKG